jgi:hypothetical protein
LEHYSKPLPVIVENAFLARLAAIKLNSPAVAMVWKDRIYLSGVSKEAFLKDRKWLVHEMVHIAQFRRHGTFRFVFLYLFEWIKKGYRNNKYEIEAREKAEVTTQS